MPFSPRTARRRASALASAALAVCLSGCLDFLGGGPSVEADQDSLRIATPWPRGERASLARAFAEWLREDGRDERLSATAIAWVETTEDAPRNHVLRQGGPAPDLLLGGPVSDYERLAAEGRLDALGNAAAKPYWVVARVSRVGPSKAAKGGDGFAPADPRIDARSLAWCLGRLNDRGWREGYAELLDLHGRSATAVGWRADSARAAVARGLAGEAVDVLTEPNEGGVGWKYEEGAAVVHGSKRARSARVFLRFLVESQGARTGPAFESAALAERSAVADSLAADLLGSTLVDAQDELTAAVAAVRKAGSPDWAVARLTEPPPWPPASIAKLLAREGEAGLALAETLISQAAPDPSLRRWLTQDWLKPRRDLDLSVLSEIAAAERGRLAREPRFRAWLKAEWTQWARQRYRWVARLAAGDAPPPPLASSES